MKHKVTVELFKVHSSFKVSFSVFLDYLDEKDPTNKFQPLVSKFVLEGNEYIKIVPHSFLTVDITSKMDKKEGVFNKNTYFTLGKMEIFYFINGITKLINIFSDKSIPLYSRDEEEILHVNPELANEYTLNLRAQSSKIIRIIPAVVEQDLIQYEGVCLYINSIDNFVYLTISELCYFLYELKKVDLVTLSLNSIITYHLLDERYLNKVELPKRPPVREEVKQEVIDVKPRIGAIQNTPTIPNI